MELRYFSIRTENLSDDSGITGKFLRGSNSVFNVVISMLDLDVEAKTTDPFVAFLFQSINEYRNDPTIALFHYSSGNWEISLYMSKGSFASITMRFDWLKRPEWADLDVVKEVDEMLVGINAQLADPAGYYERGFWNDPTDVAPIDFFRMNGYALKY